jgi:hypothetical protein
VVNEATTGAQKLIPVSRLFEKLLDFVHFGRVRAYTKFAKVRVLRDSHINQIIRRTELCKHFAVVRILLDAHEEGVVH